MRRAVVVTGLVAVVALSWALLPSRPEGRAGASGTKPLSPVQPVTGDDAAAAQPGVPAAESEEVHGTITGTLRYEDGAPAVGVTVHCAETVVVDATGAFRVDRARPGYHSICVGRDVWLQDLWLGAGESRHVDLVVARGGTVRGRVLSADDQIPVECAVDLVTREGRILCREEASGGSFDFGWVPGGDHHVVAHGSHAHRVRADDEAAAAAPLGLDDQDTDSEFLPRLARVAGPTLRTTVVACEVGSTDVVLEIRLPRHEAVEFRFDNLPRDWQALNLEFVARYVLDWRDDRGLRVTLPPSNAIGWPYGGPSNTVFDSEGTVFPSAPPPGRYTVSFVDPYGRAPAWVQQEVTIPEGAPPRQAVRLPDGARVALVTRAEGGFAIGPAIAFAESDCLAVFPRVPAGHHGIWRLDRFCQVRVGEVDVPAAGTVRHELGPHGTAVLHGNLESAEGDRPVEVLREADDGVVAREYACRHRFGFFGLGAGRYTLVVKGRRIPIALVEGQDLDLGVIR